MRETLPVALKLNFSDEGGYSNVKTDAGGATKYGITYKTLAAHEGMSLNAAKQAISTMPLSKAEEIYRAGYWPQSGGDLLPAGLDYAVFNAGVMSGPARAVKVLQQVLGVVADGNAGPATLAAVRAYPGGVRKLIVAYCDAYMDYLQAIKSPSTGFPKNGRGWTIRITGKDPKGEYADKSGVVGNALKLAAGVPVVAASPDSPAVPAGGAAKALPPTPNPWAKPEVILPGAGALIGGSGTLLSGAGPVQFAVALAIVAAVGLGIFFAIKRIKATPA